MHGVCESRENKVEAFQLENRSNKAKKEAAIAHVGELMR